MLGSLGHLSLLTVPTSQKKHQGTLDWGAKERLPGKHSCLEPPSWLSSSAWCPPVG